MAKIRLTKKTAIIISSVVISFLLIVPAIAMINSATHQENDAKQTNTGNTNNDTESKSIKVDESESVEQEITETNNDSESISPQTTTSQQRITDNSRVDEPQGQTSVNQQQSARITPSCNESMKVSYKNLYDAQVTGENTRWSNQISGFSAEAARRGMSFSGYVQSQIDIYKPAHDASLAGFESQYQSNLANIYCS